MSRLEPWRILKSRQTYKDQWLSVRSDTCQRADGHIIDPFHIIEAREWINITALTDEGNVVLIREYRHGAQLVTIGLPGGCAKTGETDIDAVAKRELLEETGYACDRLVCVGRCYSNWANHTNHISCYLGIGAKRVADQSLDPNEEIDVLEKPFSEFLQYENNGPQISHHAANLFYVERFFAKHPELRPQSLPPR